ncbi:hypothetical protein C478_01900 [Natrinema thermotolerans DSM 11552]|nr:hypothetical protein C478_01900 [Natrinema thermotolerans DSM 11552]
MVPNAVRFPQILASLFLLASTAILYEPSQPLSLKLLYSGLVISSLLLAIEGPKKHHMHFSLGIPVVLSGGVILYTDELPAVYALLSLVVGAYAIKLGRDALKRSSDANRSSA